MVSDTAIVAAAFPIGLLILAPFIVQERRGHRRFMRDHEMIMAALARARRNTEKAVSELAGWEVMADETNRQNDQS